MNAADFYNIMCRPFDLTDQEIDKIDQLVKRYPYFQLAKALSLGQSKKHNETVYPLLLKKTAAYTVDRALLFDYINHKAFLEKNIQESIKELKAKNESKNQAVPSEKTAIIQKNETYTFSNWLLLCASNIKTDNNMPISQQTAIDRFIELNPKLSKPKTRQATINISLESVTENKNLMTQTLANLYVEQKKYERAIQAFKILSLKYPKKSGYFADEIKEIKRLQENKL